jgi:ribosomal protein S18 acetylase RimI-like enzyme
MSDRRVPLFCDVALAARVERVVCGLLEAGIGAALVREPDGGFFARPIGGGIATWGGDGSPLNKVAGLGFGGTPSSTELDDVELAFRAFGAKVQVELSNLASPDVGRLLTARGYQLIGYENVLGLRLPADGLPEVSADVDIGPVGAGDDEAWLDAVVEGFASPDTQGVVAHEEFARDVIARAIGDLTAAAGFSRYLARLGADVAGGASMRIDDGIAQLAGAATRPAFRRRGVQTALLVRRLVEAAAAGCTIAIVTTSPGTKSQENAQRQGFDLLYTRAVLVRE